MQTRSRHPCFRGGVGSSYHRFVKLQFGDGRIYEFHDVPYDEFTHLATVPCVGVCWNHVYRFKWPAPTRVWNMKLLEPTLTFKGS